LRNGVQFGYTGKDNFNLQRERGDENKQAGNYQKLGDITIDGIV